MFYIILFFLMFMLAIGNGLVDIGIITGKIRDAISTILLMGVILIYNGYILIFIVKKCTYSKLKEYHILEVAIINCLIKISYLPAYIFHLVMFIIGIALGVFGGFILIGIAIVMIILPMLISGFNSISCTIMLRKKKLITLPKAIIVGVLNFVYFVDIYAAIAYIFDALKYKNNDKLEVNNAEI